MNKPFNICMTVLVGLLLSSGSLAQSSETKQQILDNLQERLPDLSLEADQLSPSPIDGLWVLTVGPEVVYVDEQGQYLIQGDLINLDGRSNLTEESREQARRAAIANIADDRKISYVADEESHRLTVFTDIDCGYCRQLHRDMDELNQAGISVDYLFYPRGGKDSPAWEKSERVWCSDDRHAAMDHAKSGGSVKSEDCDDTPTERHFQLGRQMQLSGTPSLVTESGRLIRGYIPVEQLIQELETDNTDR